MQKRNLELKWVPILMSFFFISLCVMIFPKYGTTHNHTGSATATATAEKTGQNWFWSTYKTHAKMVVESAPNDIGVYEMRVKVTGKKEKTTWYVGLGGGTTVPFTSGACAYTDDLEDGKTYRKWGSGSGNDISISASSSGNISGSNTSASDSCSASYPQQP